MKKILLSSIAFTSLVLFLSSCAKDSYICRNSGDEITFNKADYPSTKAYNEDLKKIKALGFACK